VWTDYGAWSECSRSCDRGTQVSAAGHVTEAHRSVQQVSAAGHVTEAHRSVQQVM
jgi:hypothetical protein